MASEKRKRLLYATGAAVVALGAVLGVVLFAGSAQAGRRADSFVGLSADGLAAWGSMGSARGTITDTAQFVRCEVVGSDLSPPGSLPIVPGPLTAKCVFADSTATTGGAGTGPGTRMCITGNPSVIAAIQSAGDSRVFVQLKAGSNECSMVSVINSSEYGSKQP